MNWVERTIINMVYELNKPSVFNVCALIRWKDSGELERCLIRVGDTDGEHYSKDEDIFFYVKDMEELLSLCANLDFTHVEYDNEEDYYAEIGKYSEDADNYFHSHEDFDICTFYEIIPDNPIVYVVVMDKAIDCECEEDTMVFGNLERAKKALKDAFNEFVRENYDEDGVFNTIEETENSESACIYCDGEYTMNHYALNLYKRIIL